MKSGWENLSNTFRSICASFDPVFFFPITVYSSIHVSGNVCVCVCVHVNVHHKDMLFYDESRYSRCHSCKMAFPAKGFMLLMVFELNWCTILLNILVYWFIFPHKKAKKKKIFSSFLLFLSSFTDKLVNVHIKLNHYTLLNTFYRVFCDHLSPWLSE